MADSNKGPLGGEYYTADAPGVTDKYKHPHQLDGIQTDPTQLKNIDFKQDYTVLIRKKKYYAITQQSDELYVRVYQINNFMGISTSHNVGGTPGNCSVTLKGGERVVCADKDQLDNTKLSSFEQVKSNFNSIDNENSAENTVNNVKYEDLATSREYKYSWKYAEKCDWEPMDEIYIFSKSKIAKDGSSSSDPYSFEQIFFGYITSVTKTYAAGSQGPQIKIMAHDHLKLLQISWMSMRPPLDMATGGVGVRYDGFGNMIIEDDPTQLVNTFQNFFAGDYVHEIIRSCCMAAGIPQKYLNGRIEPIMRVPFTPQYQGNNFTELFRGEFKNRLSWCSDAANICNLEFFADESGNIVLKIPSYRVGVNRLSANFEGDQYVKNTNLFPVKEETDWTVVKQPIYETEKVTSSGNAPISYTVKPGDNLWDIAKKYYGDGAKWKKLWNDNKNHLKSKNPNLIYPGENITIYPENGSSSLSDTGTGDLWYTIKKGDSLSSIAKKFLGDALKWRELWNLNAKTLRSGNPNLIYPGEKILIKKGTAIQKTTQKLVGYKEVKTATTKKINDLPNPDDYLIKIIKPEDIIAFSLVDTDQGVYTAATVTAEIPLMNSTMQQIPPAVTRAVEDFDLIRQFGYRPAPAINTPLVGGANGAAIYAALILLKSISNRFTGSLTIIEESTIRVGDPIRFMPYDEHPISEIVDRNLDPYQAVYYVDAIDRQINLAGVSVMTLSLKAGREYGMKSIYDNCQELYRYFYEDDIQNDPATTDKNNQTNQTNQQKVIQTTYKTYTVKVGDSLSGIAKKYYGDPSQWKKIFDANSKASGKGSLVKPNLIYPGQVLKIPN